MAAMPNLSQVSGNHNAIYEAYHKQVDPKGTGVIDAIDAAKFLKKSGLSDVVLSRIWDLSDPAGKGYLDKTGLFVALKLVSLAQAGYDMSMKNIYMESNAPKVGDLPKISTTVKSLPPGSTDWSMKPAEKVKYEQLFETLGPMNGLLAGAKVRSVLMDSKLPVDTLGKIWDLADQDRDGSLDKHEFVVAMHLVYQALDKRAIPSSLPIQLQRPKVTPPAQNNNFDAFGSDGGFVANFPTDIAPPVVPPLPSSIPPAIPPMSRVPPTVPMVPLIPTDTAPPKVDWVVSSQDKVRYDAIFARSDSDRDGLVSGLEIKDVFLKSGLPQHCLAHIWALCDTNQCGKLRLEEFCLAMWLVERSQKGIDPPQVLASNMVPPSLRSSSDILIPQSEPQPTYTNPELEMISKEIEELAKERRLLESEVAQKEADVRIKGGEVRSLQSELDTLTATLKQLENQKGEAQKRLDDLKTQVNKIREQCHKQESTLKEQETELDSRRSELQKLKDEEHSLEKEYDAGQKEVDALTHKLQETQLQISQVKAMVTQIQEYQRQMTDALSMFRTAIESNDPILVSDYSLKIDPEFREAKQVLEDKEEVAKADPFNENKSNGFGDNGDGFTADFKTNGFTTKFDNTNGFSSTGFDDGFGSQAFGSAFDKKPNDPFASAGAAAADPFGDKKTPAHDGGKDEFGCDPFAILHAPTSASQILSPSPNKSVAPPRPESPSPALPPKKAKQPPPRPAPPRPLQGPTPTKPIPPATDAFGDSSGTGSFANFADFETKKVADFQEDPFKDYRYEDPFSIQDPFADDDESATTSEDPFSSDSNSALNSKYRNYPLQITDENVNLILKKDHLDKFVSKLIVDDDLFNDHKNNNTNSPINLDKLDPFSVNNNTTSIKNNNNSINDHSLNSLALSSNDIKDDFFDAFNDNFSKNNSKASKKNLFKAFGVDDFDSTTTAITTTSTTTSSTPALAFISSGINNNLSHKKSSTPKFGIDYQTYFESSKENKFEDEFAKMDDHFGKLDISSNDNNNSNFAKFDAFNLNASSNTTKSDLNNDDAFSIITKKIVNTTDSKNTDTPPPIPKYSADYSKTDNFDADLESVLQRSIVEK